MIPICFAVQGSSLADPNVGLVGPAFLLFSNIKIFGIMFLLLTVDGTTRRFEMDEAAAALAVLTALKRPDVHLEVHR